MLTAVNFTKACYWQVRVAVSITGKGTSRNKGQSFAEINTIHGYHSAVQKVYPPNA
jgi:hypothetical protein